MLNGQLVQIETGWYVLPICRHHLSDLGVVIALGCMAALFKY